MINRTAGSAEPDDRGVVAVIDDDESLRTALTSLFRSVELPVRCYASVSQFLAERPPEVRGCLVVDVRLPGLSGLEFQSQLAQHEIAVPVILMTGHGDIPMSVRAMKAGAVDFLPKPFRDQDMLDAVAAALAQDAARRQAQSALDGLRGRHAGLTSREREILGHVVAGRLNKQIAGDLGLSEITVKVHRGNMMRKMEARSVADLVRMAEALEVPLQHPGHRSPRP